MHHEQTKHSKRHLGHFIVMRVIHEGAMLSQRELVFERFKRLNDLLCQAADAIHAVWQKYPVPMHSGGFRQFVGYIDADPVAFDGFNRRPMHAAIITPTIRFEAECELMRHRFGYEMEH